MFNYKKSIKIFKILYKIFIITFLISILKNAIVLATDQPQIPTANVREINTSTEEYYTSVYIAITILFITINVMVTNFIAMVYQKKTNNKVSKVSKIILIICWKNKVCIFRRVRRTDKLFYSRSMLWTFTNFTYLPYYSRNYNDLSKD